MVAGILSIEILNVSISRLTVAPELPVPDNLITIRDPSSKNIRIPWCVNAKMIIKQLIFNSFAIIKKNLDFYVKNN